VSAGKVVCPAWCTQEMPHDSTDLDRRPIQHTAPAFGNGEWVAIFQFDDGTDPGYEMLIDVPAANWDVANAEDRKRFASELLDLAMSALAAAKWLQEL